MTTPTDTRYEDLMAALITRTMRAQGFKGDIKVTNVRRTRSGTNLADVRATYRLVECDYKASVGGKRGIVVKKVSAPRKMEV